MITSTKNIHAAKTQLYRWYNGYERPFTIARIRHQMELLANDVFIKTPNGELKGKKSYPSLVGKYRGMKISHVMKHITVDEATNGQLYLTADVVYHGIQSNGQDNCFTFHYEHILIPRVGQLPVFKEILLQPTGMLETPTFQDSYPTFRMMALMHYWLYNVERLTATIDPFKEILVTDFQLNFPSEQITTLDQFAIWLTKAANQLEITSHYPRDVSVESIAENVFQLRVTFDWEGVTKTEQKMTGITRHVWVATNHLKERFAKIKSMDVEVLSPFSIIN